MNSKLLIVCRRCARETNHSSVTKHEVSWGGQREYDASGSTEYHLLCCDGCAGFSFLKRAWHSELSDPEHGQWSSDQQISLEDTQPDWLDEPFFALGSGIDTKLLLEANSALDYNCPSASCLALRAFIERMLISSVGDTGTIAGNLEKYSSAGQISKPQREALDAVIEAGHAVMHRGYHPSTSDVATWLDVVLTLVKTNYYDPQVAKTPTKEIPKRVGTKRSPSASQSE